MGKIIREISGASNPIEGKIALVASRFNEGVVENLIKGAEQGFARYGLSQEQLVLMRVPGAYEIPFAALQAAQTGEYVGVMALGAVIRGQTAHFEYVASCCSHGLMDVQLKTNIPISYCVLTTDTTEQAQDRADPNKGNIGAEYALSLLEMIHLVENIRG